MGGELLLHYQPKIDLATGWVVGVEALVRWLHPGEGLLMPVDFVPLAENTGLIAPLTLRVLDQALAQVTRWSRAGGGCRWPSTSRSGACTMPRCPSRSAGC